MPVFVKQRGVKFQMRVIHKLLPKPYFHTFVTEEEARAYGQRLQAMLDQGHIPLGLLSGPAASANDWTLPEVIDKYCEHAPVTRSDADLLPVLKQEVKGVRVSGVTFLWAEEYVTGLKRTQNLAPGTIRKRVGALARVIDWHLRRTGASEKVGSNPLRQMPAGYSQYTEEEGKKLASSGKVAKHDVKRDLRLSPGDEVKVVWALEGGKRDDRERALKPDPAFKMLFRLVVDTGLRLSESYRLRCDQIDVAKGIIRVEGSKGARGVLKPRTVPMKKKLREEMGLWCADRSELVFPYWDGTREGMRKATSKLSVRFGNLFEYAGVGHLTEHDLRHEACCRWLELRGDDGRWIFSDVEVCKIMGWSSMAMMLRYASLRGEDLANRLL